MANLNIEEFVQLVTEILPPKITIKVKGRHGIGKSEVTAQIAKKLGLPIVVCYMAQYSEADILGLPELSGGVTKYRKPQFLDTASKQPVLLVLEELNRARPETLQVTFPLLLERKLESNDTVLHPGTRIIALENEGADYAVTMFDDRAHASRFWSGRLNPTIEDWLRWGKLIDEKTGTQNIHPFIYDFFSLPENHGFLETTAEHQIPIGETCPDRRAWKRLSDTLVYRNLFSDLNAPILRKVCEGFVGTSATANFLDFLKKRDIKVSAKEILDSWKAAKAKLKFTGTPEDRNKYTESALKVAGYIDDGNILTPEQIDNLSEFMHDLPPELVMRVWRSVSIKGDTNPNLQNIHAKVSKLIVEVCRGGKVYISSIKPTS